MRIGSGGYNNMFAQQALAAKNKDTSNNILNDAVEQVKPDATAVMSVLDVSEVQGSGAATSKDEHTKTNKSGINTAINFDISKNINGSYNKMLEDLRAQRSELNEKTKKDVAAAKKQVLGGLLKRVEMMQGNMYSSRSWTNLMKTYGKSKSISLDENADAADLEKAIRAISGALGALQKAKPEDSKQREMLPLVMKIGGTASEQAAVSAAAKAVTQTTGLKV
jgi:hypothetical protein